MNICRFCGKPDWPMLHYSVRHYAHPRCFVAAGKDVAELSAIEVARLRRYLLENAGILEIWRKLDDLEKERELARLAQHAQANARRLVVDPPAVDLKGELNARSSE